MPRNGAFNLNTFCRQNHFDKERNMNMNYGGDEEDFRYRVGDNTAHATGMEPALRLRVLLTLARWIDQSPA